MDCHGSIASYRGSIAAVVVLIGREQAEDCSKDGREDGKLTNAEKMLLTLIDCGRYLISYKKYINYHCLANLESTWVFKAGGWYKPTYNIFHYNVKYYFLNIM